MVLLSNGQVANKAVIDTSIPFLRLAFRPLFWLGALFSAISIAIWALFFTGYINFAPYGGSYFWHAHEMLFGFTAAIIAGFLLTAVQTWTGVASIKGLPLGVLVGIWLLARVLLVFQREGFELFTAIVDLLFLPFAALALAIPIIRAKMWRNLFFVPIMLAMAILNGLTHLSVQGKLAISFIDIIHIMVLVVSLVMCIMGGRVFPMFTANGTGTQKVVPIAWIEKSAVASIVLSILITINFVDTPNILDGSIYLFAGVVNLIRTLRWRIWVTFSTPLVWTLHISYWAICIGFIMLSLVKFDLLTSASTAFHAITVGGIGVMILSMISRVSLGHTGRKIQVGKVMNAAFILMVMSFIIRVFFPFVWSDYTLIILASAACWVVAFSLFVFKYTDVLFKARIDGANG
jgi:uncharacterized protein involved in response to NO